MPGGALAVARYPMRRSASRPLGTLGPDRADSAGAAASDVAYDEGGEHVADLAREAERREIACELHDTVIQPLASLIMNFELLRQQTLTPGMIESTLSAWTDLAQEALDSLRCTLAGLHAHPHGQRALPDELKRFLLPDVRSRGLRLQLEARDWPPDLPVDFTTSLYLVVREAITNIEKHAHASEASILLEGNRAEVRIFLADNGVGFCPEEVAQRATLRTGHGVGLGSMRDRIRKLGGRCDIAAAPGQGVRVDMTVPQPSNRPMGSQAHEKAPVPKRARKGRTSPYTH